MTASEIEQRFTAIDKTMAKLDEKLDRLRGLLARNEATAEADPYAGDPFARSIRDSIVRGHA